MEAEKRQKRERWLLHLPVPKCEDKRTKTINQKRSKTQKIVNVYLCTFLCQNGRREDDSTSFDENTICPDIDKERGEAQIYLFKTYLLLKLVIDSCLF